MNETRKCPYCENRGTGGSVIVGKVEIVTRQIGDEYYIIIKPQEEVVPFQATDDE